MFQETKELPVTTSLKVGKYHELADAMRRGSLVVRPAPGYGTYDPSEGCALCCLATGLGRQVGFALVSDGGVVRLELNRRYGRKIINEIEQRFEGWFKWDGNPQSFEQIAAWLESL